MCYHWSLYNIFSFAYAYADDNHDHYSVDPWTTIYYIVVHGWSSVQKEFLCCRSALWRCCRGFGPWFWILRLQWRSLDEWESVPWFCWDYVGCVSFSDFILPSQLGFCCLVAPLASKYEELDVTDFISLITPKRYFWHRWQMRDTSSVLRLRHCIKWCWSASTLNMVQDKIVHWVLTYFIHLMPYPWILTLTQHNNHNKLLLRRNETRLVAYIWPSFIYQHKISNFYHSLIKFSFVL